mmetsp:Transcript_38099/g.69930  ORF Transcript_38099/g.69930 Transcript_38099/m.69930 type:complete len:125 (-) Transcript_38099:150-524(-)
MDGEPDGIRLGLTEIVGDSVSGICVTCGLNGVGAIDGSEELEGDIDNDGTVVEIELGLKEIEGTSVNSLVGYEEGICVISDGKSVGAKLGAVLIDGPREGWRLGFVETDGKSVGITLGADEIEG